MAKAHLFDYNELDPLKCHKDDCVPNVLAYLNLLEHDEAFEFANVNDQVLVKNVIDFLDKTYGVKHELLKIYENYEDPTPDMIDDDILYAENGIVENLYKQLKNNKVAFGLFLGKAPHVALFGKKDDEIYIIDPQAGEEYLIEDPNIGLYLYKYNEIYIVTSPEPVHFKINSTNFKQSSKMYTMRTRIKTNPNTLKWSRSVLHHRILKPNRKYKIINKKTNKTMDAVFLKQDPKVSIFEKGSEKILVNTEDHYFILLKKTRPKRSFHKSKRKGSRKYVSI